MKPQLARWASEMGANGLEVVSIEVLIMDPRELVEEEAKRYPFRTLVDAQSENARSYEVEEYPTAFLVGRDGKLAWQGNPLEDLDALEARVKEELAKPAP